MITYPVLPNIRKSRFLREHALARRRLGRKALQQDNTHSSGKAPPQEGTSAGRRFSHFRKSILAPATRHFSEETLEEEEISVRRQ
jgi:hypothetical protein